MFYTVYKVTNSVNNKTYIGVHKTLNPEDNYFGSGIAIKRAIKKYGLENFKKEILFIFDNAEEAFKKECEIVKINESSYNLKEGGCGGFDHLSDLQRRCDKSHMKMMSNIHHTRMREDICYRQTWLKRVSAGRLRFTQANPNFNFRKGKTGSFKGKIHSSETKQRISNTMKQFIGSKSSGFGKLYINRDGITKRVSNQNLDEYLNDGWSMGRVLKRGV